jgi:hypothetical protein
MNREIATAALSKKLQEEDLDEKEAATFEGFLKETIAEVHQLKVILQGLEAKEKERSWIRHQSSGDLDESKVKSFNCNSWIEWLVGRSWWKE